MLTNLIKTVFGHRHPQELLEQQLQYHWQHWFKPISQDSPVGDDLSYDDSFQNIKDEITKISGINAAMIAQTCEDILLNRSKDLRVTCYYIWARLRMDGSAGFADGLELLSGLLCYYGETLHPKRPETRKMSLEWLKTEKFTDLLETVSVQPEDMRRAIAALAFIIELTDEWDERGRPDLQFLIRYFESQLEQPEPAAKESATVDSAVLAPQPESVRSLRDVLDQTRKMALFLREQPDGYLTAMRLLRTVRWDTITLLPPSDDKGFTRLHPPRAELRQHLHRLWLQKHWTELLEQCERAFAEAANHFWLDLQRYACEALTNAGEPYASWLDTCVTDVALMLERLKGLEHLHYSDGTPFADDDTRAWITKTATVSYLDQGEPLSVMPIDSGGTLDWFEMERQAIDMAERNGLESAFHWLQSLPGITTEKQRYLHRFLLARVAELHGRREVAIRLLTPLNQDLMRYSLPDWEPELVFEIKARLLKLVQQQTLLKDVDKTELTKQADELMKQLTVLNPARALML